MSKKISTLFLLFFILLGTLSLSPRTAQADQVVCGLDPLYTNAPSNPTEVVANWWMYSTQGGTFFDVYLSWDGGPKILLGKEDGTDSYSLAGMSTMNFPQYGTHSATISVGSVVCQVTQYITMTAPQSNPLGTICVQVYGGPSSAHFTLTKPDGTTNAYDTGSFCTDDIAGTWTIGQLTSLNGYNGPYLMQPGTGQSVPIGASQTVSDGGWIGWDLTYSPWKYRCSGAGSCIRDDVNGNTTDPTCNNSCVAPPNVPTASISASPQTIAYGGSSTITWSSTDATSCTVTPSNWSGTSGSRSTGSLTSNTTYTLNCSGAGGSASSAVTVSVMPPNTAVNGACGTANKTYPSTATSYGSDTYCSAGTPNSSPAFPSPGNSANWTCLGQNGGVNSSQCTASVSALQGTTYSVTVTKMGNGSVASNDGLLNCGSTCTKSYAKNSTVILTATPASSYWKFNGWGGDCAQYGVGVNCALTVDAAKTAIATFTLRLFNYKEF